MVVGDIIVRRKILKSKIPELQIRLEQRGCVNKEDYDNTVSELFNLISELQSFSILLERSNNTTKVKIGDKEITISDALIVKETLKMKIDVFSGLINKTPENKFSVLTLFSQRDNLMEEYLVISKAITLSDWRTEVV